MDVTGGYNPATGEITAGVGLVFTTGPNAETLTALQLAGAYGTNNIWGFAAVTNQVQRDAVTRALAEGADLVGPGETLKYRRR